MPLSLTEIEALFEREGGRCYAGEPVTQLEHALQSALLAEQAAAGAELITAALLHDLGHLINDRGETPTLRGIDDRHERAAISGLRALFGDAVLAPIRLHVEAKRYLCARGDGVVNGAEYEAALSPDSLRSLHLQGGAYDESLADRFIMQAHAPEAVRLRRWDDLAKAPGKPTPPLAHYLRIAARVARA